MSLFNATISPIGFVPTREQYAAAYDLLNRLIWEINPALTGKMVRLPPAPGEIERSGAAGMLMATWLVACGARLAQLPAASAPREANRAIALGLMNFEAVQYRKGLGSYSSREPDIVLPFMERLVASLAVQPPAAGPAAAAVPQAALAAIDRAKAALDDARRQIAGGRG